MKSGNEYIAEGQEHLVHVPESIPARDDAYEWGELIQAARCYYFSFHEKDLVPSQWPWADKYWKPGDRRQNLIKAGALVRIQIERLKILESRLTSEIEGIV